MQRVAPGQRGNGRAVVRGEARKPALFRAPAHRDEGTYDFVSNQMRMLPKGCDE